MIAFADYTLERIPVAPAPAPAPTPEVRALSSSRQGHFRGAGGALGELWGSARYRDPPVHHSRSQAPAWERTAPEAPPRFQAEPVNHGGSQAGAWEPDIPCALRLTHFCETSFRHPNDTMLVIFPTLRARPLPPPDELSGFELQRADRVTATRGRTPATRPLPISTAHCRSCEVPCADIVPGSRSVRRIRRAGPN